MLSSFKKFITLTSIDHQSELKHLKKTNKTRLNKTKLKMIIIKRNYKIIPKLESEIVGVLEDWQFFSPLNST